MNSVHRHFVVGQGAGEAGADSGVVKLRLAQFGLEGDDARTAVECLHVLDEQVKPAAAPCGAATARA
jgi:hypothetical protein